MFDIIIPYHIKDAYTIEECVKSFIQFIRGYNKIYIISAIDPKIQDTEWISDSLFSFNAEIITQTNNIIPPARAGWYFQQLIKLHIHTIPNILPTALIIDSDVIFVSPVEFFEGELPLYTYSDEYTSDYFDNMRVLNSYFERSVNVSGIAHMCVFEKHIIDEIFDLIKVDGEKVWETIIKSVKEWHHGFSEYELYFHYIHKKYPAKYKIRKLNYRDVTDFKTCNKNNLHYVANHAWMREQNKL